MALPVLLLVACWMLPALLICSQYVMEVVHDRRRASLCATTPRSGPINRNEQRLVSVMQPIVDRGERRFASPSATGGVRTSVPTIKYVEAPMLLIDREGNVCVQRCTMYLN